MKSNKLIPTPENIQKSVREIAEKDKSESICRELSEMLIKSYSLKGTKRKEIYQQIDEKFKVALKLDNLNNHYLATASVDKEYQEFLSIFIKTLILEYNCSTASEKSLAQIIGINYIRVLRYSANLEKCTNLKYLTEVATGYYGMISKELDRAERQYMTALMLLKQLKTPELKVSIKANTAFIAQQQQINADKPNTYDNTIKG
ncbi:MAG: hypothetical protein HYV32_03085 [Candidatus Kerfeldbacteria bacterium]|nr:hypothetical protein [Candidatus Kerfeldbacteria bacterium]